VTQARRRKSFERAKLRPELIKKSFLKLSLRLKRSEKDVEGKRKAQSEELSPEVFHFARFLPFAAEEERRRRKIIMSPPLWVARSFIPLQTPQHERVVPQSGRQFIILTN
jgi:hypothetical protein